MASGLSVMREILQQDDRAPRKERHTSNSVFVLLGEGHASGRGFASGYCPTVLRSSGQPRAPKRICLPGVGSKGLFSGYALYLILYK